jgi:hypothetical protein
MRGTYFRLSSYAPALVAAVLALSLVAPANADPEPQYGWREVWTGADASSHVWLLYSGATVAPYGHIYSEGLRLRAAGGYGRYSYIGDRRGVPQAFNAETNYGEALVGYLKTFGPLTAKAFVGIAVIEHDVTPFDPANPVQGQEVGPKVATELWLNVGSSGWSSLDASWTTAHGTAAARMRTGYRIYGDASIGLEGGINANDLGEDARGGLFARYAWQGGEISMSGGYSGRFLDEADALRDPYATVNWLTQF